MGLFVNPCHHINSFMRKLYRILLIIILIHFVQNSKAQNDLVIEVRDLHSNFLLPGVTVSLPDLRAYAVTDTLGKVSMKVLPRGKYLVAISSIGYATSIEPVTVEGHTRLEVLLRRSDVALKEVIVTGVTSAADRQKTPLAVSVMGSKDLLENGGTNIIDAITRIPGVSAITDGQSIAKPVIRGLGYNRVVTVADGVTQQGQQWGDEFGIEVDQMAVNRVEILKGPGSLVYGSDAISGVVNLIPEPILPDGEIKGQLLFNYQTNNGLIANMFNIAGNEKGLAWSFRIDNTMAHAYQNPNDGYVLNSQFSNFNLDATIGLHRNWGYTQFHFSHFDLRTGIVDGTRDSATGILERQMALGDSVFYVIPTKQELKSYTPFLINQAVHHEKLVWDNSIATRNGRITATLAWQQNRRQENNDPTMPDVSDIYYFLNSYNYDLRYISNPWHDFSFSAGVNGIYQNSKNRGTLLLIPEYDLFSIGGFAIGSKKIGNLNLSGGLRYDTRTFRGHDNFVDSGGNELSPGAPDAIHRFTAYKSDFSGFSGSLGGTYQFNSGLYLKANLSRGFRAANVAETGSNGIHDGTVVYEIGDPDLKPETSLEFDLGPGFSSPDISAEISFFVNNISNYIYPNSLKSVNGGDSVNNSTPGFGDAPVFKYTQRNARLLGGEAEVTVHPQSIRWLNWYAGFSCVDAYLKNMPDSSKYPPFIPPARFQSELRIDFGGKSRVLSHSYVKLGVLHSFEQTHLYDGSSIYMGLSDFELAASKAPTRAYTLFSFGAGSDILTSRGTKLCSVYLLFNNIFNTTYMDYMSRFKYYPANFAVNPVRVGVYNMGRNLSVKLVLPLNFKGA